MHEGRSYCLLVLVDRINDMPAVPSTDKQFTRLMHGVSIHVVKLSYHMFVVTLDVSSDVL